MTLYTSDTTAERLAGFLDSAQNDPRAKGVPAFNAVIAIHAREALPGLLADRETAKRLEAELARLAPYEQAIRKAHNGYDPAARAAMESLKEPVTPEQAVAELLQEGESMLDAEIAAHLATKAELARLRERIERVRQFLAEADNCGAENAQRDAVTLGYVLAILEGREHEWPEDLRVREFPPTSVSL